MLISLNPYITSNPVSSMPVIVEREDVLRKVLNILRQPRSNMLTTYEQRCIGNASVLPQIKARPLLTCVLTEAARRIAGCVNLPEANLAPDPQKRPAQMLSNAHPGCSARNKSQALLFKQCAPSAAGARGR